MQKKIFVLWWLGFFLGGVLFPGSCVAGDEVFDLGELVITATRVPALLKDVPGSCTVIDEEMIKSSKAKDLAEIIEKVAGVNVKTYSLTGTSTASIRGSFSGQVVVMVDGRPLNLASSGDVDLSLISLENVKKIEIVRGPFSSLYGSGAVGGVINIITKSPSGTSRTELGFSHGTFNSSSFAFSHGESKDKFGYFFTMSGDSSDGDRENSWKNSSGFSGKVSFSSFVFSGGYSRARRGIPGSLSWPTPNASQVDEKSWFDVSYNWQRETPGLSLKAFLNQDRIIYENPDPDWYTKDTTENRSFGANLQHTFFPLPGHEVIWGIELRENKVDVKTADGTSRIGGERKISSTALYLQDEMEIFPGFIMLAGARYDNHSICGSNIAPRISLLYHAGESTSFRASWGEGFRAPSVNDLYWQEDWGWGSGMFGNPDLLPEKSSGYEVGIEHVFSPRAVVRANFFSTSMDDLISWVEVSNWRWEAQNIDKAKISGVEGEVKLQPLKDLSIFLNLTLLEAKDEKEFEGKILPYRPQNEFALTLNWEASSSLRFRVEGKVVGERYADRENEEKLPAYTLLGAAVTFTPQERVEVFLRADNLLDEDYQVIKDYPMPGLTLKGGVRVTL